MPPRSTPVTNGARGRPTVLGAMEFNSTEDLYLYAMEVRKQLDRMGMELEMASHVLYQRLAAQRGGFSDQFTARNSARRVVRPLRRAAVDCHAAGKQGIVMWKMFVRLYGPMIQPAGRGRNAAFNFQEGRRRVGS